MKNALFDQAPDRSNSPSSKFNPLALRHIFGTTELYPFWIADQDFLAAPFILEALQEKVNFGIFGYEYKPSGFLPAVTGWYKRRYGYEPDHRMLQFSPTITTTVALSLELFTAPGSSVILQTPAYADFPPTIRRAGRKLLPNPLVLKNGFYEIDFDDLEHSASRNEVQALLFCSPHNPSGRVWTTAELERIIDICERHDLLLITDEIHADIVYKPHHFVPMISFARAHPRLIVAFSPAKTFNLAAIADSIALIPNARKRKSFNNIRLKYNLGRTNAFACASMQAAYSQGDQWTDSLVEYLWGNVRLVRDFLHRHTPEIELIEPQGTYLLWMNISGLDVASEKFTRTLAIEAGIGLNDGPSFSGTSDFVRMNIACPRSHISSALERLLTFVKVHRTTSQDVKS